MAVCYKKNGYVEQCHKCVLYIPLYWYPSIPTYAFLACFVEKRRILNDIYIVTATLAEIRETCPLDHIFFKITLRAWDEPHQIYQAIKFEHLDLVSAIPQTLKRALTVPSVKHHQPPRGEPTPPPHFGLERIFLVTHY